MNFDETKEDFEKHGGKSLREAESMKGIDVISDATDASEKERPKTWIYMHMFRWDVPNSERLFFALISRKLEVCEVG